MGTIKAETPFIILIMVFLSTDFSALSTEYEFGESRAQNDITGELLSLSADEIKNAIIRDTEEVLAEKGVSAENISVEVNISPDGSINISRFSLRIRGGNSEEIKQSIAQKTGLSPEIKYLGESENE